MNKSRIIILQKFMLGFVLSYIVTFTTGGGGLPELFADYFHYYFSPAAAPEIHPQKRNVDDESPSILRIDAGWNSSDMRFLRHFLSLVLEEYEDVTAFSEIPMLYKVVKEEKKRHNVTRDMELLMVNYEEVVGESNILASALSFSSKRLHFQCHEKTLTSRLMHIGNEIAYIKDIYDSFNGSTAYLVKNGGFIDARKFSVPWELHYNLVGIVDPPFAKIGQISVANKAEKTLMCQFGGSVTLCNKSMTEIDDNSALQLLQLAKSNVENYYAVVGLSNQPFNTIKLLEVLMPRFFEGTSKIYPDLNPLNVQVSKVVDPKVAAVLFEPMNMDVSMMSTPAFANDVEFYQFLAQRFFLQLDRQLKQL